MASDVIKRPGRRSEAAKPPAKRPGKARDKRGEALHTSTYAMPRTLHERLARVAKAEQRTIAAQLRVALEEWLSGREKQLSRKNEEA